jgi:hyperosmotically inducible protein
MKTRTGVIVWATTLAGVITVLSTGCNKPQEAKASAPPSTKVVAEISDSEVSTRVKAALLQDANLKSFDIAVATLKGDVRLTGMVNNQSQIDQAIKLVRSIPGVHTIHDELGIKNKA